MDMNSDEILITRLKKNDQKALELLFEKYFNPLCTFSFSMVRSIELAEEVVSDVFCNIWEKRNSLEINKNVKSYLFLAAKNQSINYINKEKPGGEDIDALIHFGQIPELYTNETGIEYRELACEIHDLLEELPPQRRLIFKLHRLEGMKYKEIAEILSISINTVQKQMTEALRYIEKNRASLKALFYFLAFLLFLFP